MTRPTFQSAAGAVVDDFSAILPAEASTFTTAAQAYDPSFIERCAAIADDTRVLIDIRTTLKKVRGFSLRDFDRLIRDEKGKIFNGHANGKPNGHANGHAKNPWRELLIPTAKGDPKAILANAITAIRHAPEWKDVLAFDEFANRAVKRFKPPFLSREGDWSDTDDILAADWLQHHKIEVSPACAANAVQAVSIEHSFHPVRDYLTSLHWDGESRLSRWVTTYMGVEWSEVRSQMGAKWLISAVARIMRPGCKVDTCLILEGFQGRKKSTALGALFSDKWFSDQISADLAGKDSSQDLPGVWGFEFAEFDKLSKYDQGVIKSFIPRRKDHYRPSYGHRTVDIDRQCVFAASTNKETYLQDETGGRRWWPIPCTAIDVDAIYRDRDQLWAEAFALFQEGTREGKPNPGLWWLIDDTVIEASRSEQSARYDLDPWDSVIWNWLQDQDRLYTEKEDYTANYEKRPAEPFFIDSDTILTKCLDKPVGQWTQQDKNRVSKILRFHGFERFQRRATDEFGEPVFDSSGKQRRDWCYRKPILTT